VECLMLVIGVAALAVVAVAAAMSPTAAMVAILVAILVAIMMSHPHLPGFLGILFLLA